MHQKKVHFHHISKVILIPHLNEYYDEKLENQLWWSSKELNNMSLKYHISLKTIMCLHNITLDKAIYIINH